VELTVLSPPLSAVVWVVVASLSDEMVVEVSVGVVVAVVSVVVVFSDAAVVVAVVVAAFSAMVTLVSLGVSGGSSDEDTKRVSAHVPGIVTWLPFSILTQ